MILGAISERAPARPVPAPAPKISPRQSVQIPAWVILGGVALAIGIGVALDRNLARGRSLIPNPGRRLPRNPRSAYRAFHWGRGADRVARVQVAPRPRQLVQLGTLESVTYSTRKGADATTDYVHDFGKRGQGKPRLAYDAQGRALHIVGGRYRVEGRGIVH